MKKRERLFFNSKIEVRKSSLHGWGLFEKENINGGEFIEECQYATLQLPITGSINRYHYSWPKSEGQHHSDPEMDFSRRTIVFGYAAYYNCAKTWDEKNVDWYTDHDDDVYVFKAVKDIEKDEELCIYYGDGFWEETEPEAEKED
jgi:SET domain-containing protein